MRPGSIYPVAGSESIRYSLSVLVLAFADTLTTVTSYLLAVFAAAEVAANWWRDRDRYRADLLVNVGLLVAILLGQSQLHAAAAPSAAEAATIALLYLLQPVLLLRLVRRFHPVAAWQWRVALFAAIGGSLVPLIAPAYLGASDLILCGYLAVAMTAIARRFEREAGAAFGAGPMRLRSIAVGCWLQAAIAVTLAAAIALPSEAPLASIAGKALGVAMFAFYYVGLIGPRLVTSLWTHRELYRYLRVVNERTPDERTRETPRDLARAVAHSVSCATAGVLLFDNDEPSLLVSHTAGPSPLRGVSVPFDDGLVARVIRRGVAMTGTAADCEAPLAEAVQHAGAAVTIVPIASADHAWGALVVVRRTGALFPDVDLETLTELCRHTAVALSNTRLVTMEFDRLRRDAARLRAERERPADAAPPVRPAAIDSDRRVRVLAVEDEEGVRDYLRALLGREGYWVTVAGGHDEALRLAIDSPFDLVVTDVNMPDGSGPELVRALRRRQPYLPAVFISGLSREEFAEMAPGEEKNFLQKPFEGARLVGRVEALLQR